MDVAAMIGAPHDPAWTVWADQLQAQGDPRGELIALERLPEAERGPVQRERLTELYRPHVERVASRGRALLPGGWLVRQVERWRFGYVLELSLAQSMPGLEPQSYSALFGADELRYLSSLRVTLDRPQVEPLLDALERHRPPLTELVFFRYGWVAELDDRACDRLWAALPGLRHLSFSAYTRIAHVNHPQLTTISLLSTPGSEPSEELELVARSDLPALVRVNCLANRHHNRLFRALVERPISSLFERLEVFECPDLFAFLLDPDPWQTLDAAAHLQSSTKIIAVASPAWAESIRERLPQLDFEFILDEYDWTSPLAPKPKNRVTLGWGCGQPNFEFSDDDWAFQPSMWLGEALAAMTEAQRRAASGLISALDVSEPGQSIPFERATLLEMLRTLPYFEWSSTDEVTAVLEQHRTCCPIVALMVEAWPSK